MADSERGTGRTLALGAVAGVAGTGVMSAFQKFIEMPISGRDASSAPADLAEKVLHVRPRSGRGHAALNQAVHYGLGTMWGTAYGVAAQSGLRGARAVAAVFTVVYSGDVLLNTALGLYRPLTWSRQDWIIDITDKLVQAAATGVIFDRVLAPQKDY